VIAFAVGESNLGASRARHTLTELAVMARFPRAVGTPAATVVYGRGSPPPGPKIFIPHEAAHVARDVAPDYWQDGDVEVPVLYEAAAPEGEVLAASAGGHPLLSRAGGDVYFGFDLARAADYYLGGRGEVGWPRDAHGRPSLAGAPAWRRRTLAVAVVNHYGALLATAIKAACAAAGVPALRFKYWPDGAPFALALSHDVDRLRAPTRREMVRSSLRYARGGVGARYPLRDIIRGPAPLAPLPAILSAEEKAGCPSTFFIGAARRGPLDYAYDLDDVRGLLAELRAAGGREVGLHASYYSSADGAGLARERELLAGAAGEEVAGVRGHYLRLASEAGHAAVAAAGFDYDASLGFATAVGWRAGCCFPYRPFDGGGDKPYGFVTVPLAVMDGALFQHNRLSYRDAERAARAVIDEAAAGGGLCSLLWHYRAFRGGVFPRWGDCFAFLIAYALSLGGAALSHRAIAARYRFNAGIRVRRDEGGGVSEILFPAEAAGDVVFEVPEGWKLAAGAVQFPTSESFRVAAGVKSAAVTFARRD